VLGTSQVLLLVKFLDEVI